MGYTSLALSPNRQAVSGASVDVAARSTSDTSRQLFDVALIPVLAAALSHPGIGTTRAAAA